MKMTINDVEQHGEVIYIKVREENTKVKRSFTIESQYAAYVRKYLKRRQAFATTNHLFINCQKGRFQNVPIGRNKFIKIPKTIANFLHLPDPIKYTLASFRQKSASNLDSIGKFWFFFFNFKNSKNTTIIMALLLSFTNSNGVCAEGFTLL